MRILAFHTDAFGARGGIAQYNRDFLSAFCSHPRVTKVVSVPRVVADDTGPLPEKLRFVAGAAGSARSFLLHGARHTVVRRRYHLVVCGHVNLLPVAAAAAFAHRAPLLLVTYGIEVWKPAESPLVRALLGRVDAVVSISQATLDRFWSWSHLEHRPSHVCPNAVHLEDYGTGERPRRLVERYGLEGRRVLLTVGRLHPTERYKGMDEIITLLPRLRLAHPDLAYLIVGDGADRERLAAHARKVGVAEHVVFAGWVPEEEKADHYRLADAYVMPGRGEGFGFVYLEALACGIPVVASRLDGSREAVRDGLLGELADPDDAEGLVAAIERTLAKPRGVVPAGLDYFAWPAFEARWHAVVDSLRGSCRRG